VFYFYFMMLYFPHPMMSKFRVFLFVLIFFSNIFPLPPLFFFSTEVLPTIDILPRSCMFCGVLLHFLGRRVPTGTLPFSAEPGRRHGPGRDEMKEKKTRPNWAKFGEAGIGRGVSDDLFPEYLTFNFQLNLLFY